MNVKLITAKRVGVVIVAAAFSILQIGSAVGQSDTTRQRDREDERTDKTQKTVRLVFDYSDGVEKVFTAVPWKAKMTIAHAMAFAEQHKRGVKLKRRGSGATGFIEAIDDLENRGANGPNWVFRVNGKLGDRSYAVTNVKPGDTVLWKFDTYP